LTNDLNRGDVMLALELGGLWYFYRGSQPDFLIYVNLIV